MSDPEGISYSDFAMLAARIGQVAAAWAAHTLTLPEDLSKPVDRVIVKRFLNDIYKHIDHILDQALK